MIVQWVTLLIWSILLWQTISSGCSIILLFVLVIPLTKSTSSVEKMAVLAGATQQSLIPVPLLLMYLARFGMLLLTNCWKMHPMPTLNITMAFTSPTVTLVSGLLSGSGFKIIGLKSFLMTIFLMLRLITAEKFVLLDLLQMEMTTGS